MITESQLSTLNDTGDHLVLVIDDMEDNLMVLRTFLTRRHYRVITAKNGREGEEMALRLRPDIILLDLNMPPGRSGLEVCSNLRRHAEMADVAIIIITAMTEADCIVKGYEAGADDFVRKPFDYLELLMRIRTAIKVRRVQAQLRRVNGHLDDINRDQDEVIRVQVAELEKANRLRRCFSPEVAEQLLAQDNPFERTGERRDITVVFLDLRRFTPFAEKSPPAEVMQVLSEFHALVGPLIFAHGATLERFTGDGLMCFLGAPNDMPDHPARALAMAKSIHNEYEKLAVDWSARGCELSLGIGIASGNASVGPIGFQGRVDYAAIGSVTNLAARLVSIAEAGQVLVDESTWNRVSPSPSHLDCQEITPKGFSKPTLVHSLDCSAEL